ncbi:MAG: penicillin acylase family protein [Bacteroidetes bacterium]|nr:penicillin acylase family protein [Bacteroidota bacterium]
MKKFFLFLLLPVFSIAQQTNNNEVLSWQQHAKQVTIIRDNWGIPHIYGKTDADAVFGLLYAQCEDDFKRVEMNYIEKLGRMAEVKGESELYNDLLIRLIIDSADAVNDYNNSPTWLKKLLNAYADGINYFLYTHPNVKPVLLQRFKPWYPLLWTDGSIGAIDVSNITTTELKNFYTGSHDEISMKKYEEPVATGSNGFALAPSKTASGNAILYINPHVTFYFRPEVQVSSEEGLNAYGAVTWGQFFVYQGFNEHCGWMHTSSYTDVADLYIEKVSRKDGELYYEYNGTLKPVTEKNIMLHYLENGQLKIKNITAYFTHHGPVMAKRDGKWISVKANNRSMVSLIQSWQRTKSRNFDEYKKTMELLANTSNNTVYADDKGNIAYWHGDFIPKRDTKYNWARPVDGTTSATEWQGLHTLDEIVHVYNPSTGWIQNCNSTPFTVSGNASPKKENYPSYMAPDGQNFRGINAAKILDAGKDYTIDRIIASGYNSHLAAFDVLLPALFKAYNENKTEKNYDSLKDPINILSEWNHDATENSVATTLAVEWGQKLLPSILKEMTEDDEADIVDRTNRFAAGASSKLMLDALVNVIKELQSKFGNWRIEWGSINRYQRLTGNLQEKYDDAKPSLPVGYAASTWGCIPSFVSRAFPGTHKRYGYNGNSFICAIEFGKKVKAKSLLTGGESGDVNSKHFGDQALMYTKGIFKDVLFYKEDVLKHVERLYHPGE